MQYRSKVSYHLSFRVSRDVILVSRDETQWSVHFGINYKQLACEKKLISQCGKDYLREHSVFRAPVLQAASREPTYSKLANEKPEWKWWKTNCKDVRENTRSAVALLFLVAYERQLLDRNFLHKTKYYHRKWRNWMETIFIISNQDESESAWVPEKEDKRRLFSRLLSIRSA